MRWTSDERRAARRKASEERIQSDHGVDLNTWVRSIRSEEREAVGRAASVLTSPDSVIDDGDREVLIESLRTIAPDYADLHWRHLHLAIKRVSEGYYESGHFHAALAEALKRFVNEIRKAIGVQGQEAYAIVNQAFKLNDDGSAQIDVARPYVDAGFDIKTLKNIREGQWRLSHGVVAAFRNPGAHEEELLLIETEAMTYQDCLDALSILSHLYRHMERALELSAVPEPGHNT